MGRQGKARSFCQFTTHNSLFTKYTDDLDPKKKHNEGGSTMDMGSMMKQAQQMQSEMKKIQEELKNEIITTGSGRGAVVVTINGVMEIKSLVIDSKIAPINEPEKLAELIKDAVNDAVAKSKDIAAKKMGRLAGGLNIPGLSGLLGR